MTMPKAIPVTLTALKFSKIVQNTALAGATGSYIIGAQHETAWQQERSSKTGAATTLCHQD